MRADRQGKKLGRTKRSAKSDESSSVAIPPRISRTGSPVRRSRRKWKNREMNDQTIADPITAAIGAIQLGSVYESFKAKTLSERVSSRVECVVGKPNGQTQRVPLWAV